MPTILDGRIARAELQKKLADKVAVFKAKGGFAPTLAIVQVGDRPDTASYVKAKKKFGLEIGAEVRHVHLKESVSSDEVVEEIHRLNIDKAVTGIILQLPLPEALKANRKNIMDAIDPAKDTDGLTFSSVNRWSSLAHDSILGEANVSRVIWPATARGVGELLDF
jgi:5,10-methylene-tetrahydrofolate dehydrogenase/methenyl tetrahydrofolate cyclohydrolase